MNAKLIALSMLVLCALVGIGLYLNDAEGAEADAARARFGSAWDGNGFSVQFTVNGTKVNVLADIAADTSKVTYEKEGEASIAHTVSVGDIAYHFGVTSVSIDGVGYAFILGCENVTGEGVISPSALFPGGADLTNYNISFDGLDDSFTFQSGDGSSINLPIRDLAGEPTFVSVTMGNDEMAIESLSFEVHADDAFAIPAVCTAGWTSDANKANRDVYNDFTDAYGAFKEREAIAAHEAQLNNAEGNNRALHTAMTSRIKEHFAQLKSDVSGAVSGQERSTWGWIVNQASIDQAYQRYCGPEINGCGTKTASGEEWWNTQGVAKCDGPRTEVDKCCAFHDTKCGYNQPDIGYSKGAYASARTGICAFGAHKGGSACEHCACTGALIRCARAAKDEWWTHTCLDGSSCDAWWTAYKVELAFSLLPCWVKRTYWCGMSCSGCSGCGWGGCSGCSGCWNHWCSYNDGWSTVWDKSYGSWTAPNRCNNAVNGGVVYGDNCAVGTTGYGY